MMVEVGRGGCWSGAVETYPNYDAGGGVRWKLAKTMMLLPGRRRAEEMETCLNCDAVDAWHWVRRKLAQIGSWLGGVRGMVRTCPSYMVGVSLVMRRGGYVPKIGPNYDTFGWLRGAGLNSSALLDTRVITLSHSHELGDAHSGTPNI